MVKAANSPDYQSRLTLLNFLSEAAREITLPVFRTHVEATSKSEHYFDPVTSADIDCERALRRLIEEHFPEDGIDGEEYETKQGSSGWDWSLDPIDGTRGYVAGVPVWSTLIGVSFERNPILGSMDFPALRTVYRGVPGSAWKCDYGSERVSLKTKPCGQLQDAILGCTEPLAMFNTSELEAYQNIRRTVRFSRLGLDALGYALVAEGRMDIVIESKLKPCDVNALIPIIKGAGGTISTWLGDSPINGGQIITSGDHRVAEQAQTMLAKSAQ